MRHHPKSMSSVKDNQVALLIFLFLVRLYRSPVDLDERRKIKTNEKEERSPAGTEIQQLGHEQRFTAACR
jgi:hypothetical protein